MREKQDNNDRNSRITPATPTACMLREATQHAGNPKLEEKETRTYTLKKEEEEERPLYRYSLLYIGYSTIRFCVFISLLLLKVFLVVKLSYIN